jgi:hypothetical protein
VELDDGSRGDGKVLELTGGGAETPSMRETLPCRISVVILRCSISLALSRTSLMVFAITSSAESCVDVGCIREFMSRTILDIVS